MPRRALAAAQVLYKGTLTFTGKVAVVTGGSRGIGFAVARTLLEEGARVAITATSDATLAKARAELEGIAEPASILALKADVTQPAEVDQAIETVVRQFGGLDILVNNAGVGLFRKVADLSVEEWRTIIETNLSGVFYCCRAALPHLRVRGGGWIVNVSSLAAKHPFAEAAAYCASKAGLNAFSDALMQEVRYDGIRVACVMPGSVRTEFGARRPGNDEWRLAPEDVARVIRDLASHPSRSLPSAVEIRPAVPPKRG